MLAMRVAEWGALCFMLLANNARKEQNDTPAPMHAPRSAVATGIGAVLVMHVLSCPHYIRTGADLRTGSPSVNEVCVLFIY